MVTESFYEWKPEYLNAVIGILLPAVGFTFYWFLAHSQRVKNRIFSRFGNDPHDKAWIYYVLFQKLSGVLFIGLIPGMICLWLLPYSMSDLGLSLQNFSQSLLYILGLGTLIFTLNSQVSPKLFKLDTYPEMRLTTWTPLRILINSLAWLVYLLAYEFMFRGILLIVCFDSFGFWPAVAINLAYYSAVHIPKGTFEAFGAFFFGFLLCFITLSTGSLLVAVCVHLTQSLSNDFFSIWHSPHMRFARKGLPALAGKTET